MKHQLTKEILTNNFKSIQQLPTLKTTIKQNMHKMLPAVFLKVDDPSGSAKGSRELRDMSECRGKMQPQIPPPPLVILNWIQKSKSNCRVWNLNTAATHQATLGFSIASQLQRSAVEETSPYLFTSICTIAEDNNTDWTNYREERKEVSPCSIPQFWSPMLFQNLSTVRQMKVWLLISSQGFLQTGAAAAQI